MNKNAIKKFAIEARKKLIASVSDKAGMLGITSEGCSEPVSKGTDFEVYKTIAGTEITLGKSQCEQRRKLKEQIETRGFEAVVEEVAYTWFNRICAIRFMEVNDYLPTRVRVLSSEKEGKNEPDIVTQAPDVNLDFTDKEREFILACKNNNKLDELFKMLFIKQCNKLSEILPGLFEKTEDYTELLLNISFTNEYDVVRMLVDGISESDFNISTSNIDGKATGQVEIIGWLYQYYNTEPKSIVDAYVKKGKRVLKTDIPAKTQIFTPHWVVRYMVENSIGRVWINHLLANNSGKNQKEIANEFGWTYFLESEEMNLNDYKNIVPEDIKVIDPCMGSGHFIIAIFDVLMDIYMNAGYSSRDAAIKIIKNNIFGIDIDMRAYQLAYFSLIMKARTYNRRLFQNDVLYDINQNICFWEEGIDKNVISQIANSFVLWFDNEEIEMINELSELYMSAKEYGSLIVINEDKFGNKIDGLLTKIQEFIEGSHEFYVDNALDIFQYDLVNNVFPIISNLLKQTLIMMNKYDVVITNPPYLGSKSMNDNLSEFIKYNYPNEKADLYCCFISKGFSMLKSVGYNAMVTISAWMYSSSCEKFRKTIMGRRTLINLTEMDNMVMGIAFNTVAFVFSNKYIKNYYATCNFVKLDNIQEGMPVIFPEKNEKLCKTILEKFSSIPGIPFAYWVSEKKLNAYKNNLLKDVGNAKSGLQTGDNERFLRLWFEVEVNKIAFDMHDKKEFLESKKKWTPQIKGGEYRKWYGNLDYVVNWEDDGFEIRNCKSNRLNAMANEELFFKKGVTWSHTTSGAFGARFLPEGHLFNVEAPMYFNDTYNDYYVLGLLNSSTAMAFINLVSTALHYLVGNISTIPIIYNETYADEIIELVSLCIDVCKTDWNSYENSWDFCKNPLLLIKNDETKIEDCWKRWELITNERFSKLCVAEERLNHIFSQIYNLDGEVENSVNARYVSYRCADVNKDMKNLISYAIGTMFGRYSVDSEGIVYAGGEEDKDKLISDEIVADNILVITDKKYFDNDIVFKLCEWVEKMFGRENFEENITFIASAVCSKGNNYEEKLRIYFQSEFYKDHCEMYSIVGSGKRPIYWMFSSGKENAFKAIIYLHRYNVDVVGVIRTEYIHKLQQMIDNHIERAQYVFDNTKNNSEKASSQKEIVKLKRQHEELRLYDEAIGHIANKRIEIDLDDGVKFNYAKFQGVVVSSEGKKDKLIDLLEKI